MSHLPIPRPASRPTTPKTQSTSSRLHSKCQQARRHTRASSLSRHGSTTPGGSKASPPMIRLFFCLPTNAPTSWLQLALSPSSRSTLSPMSPTAAPRSCTCRDRYEPQPSCAAASADAWCAARDPARRAASSLRACRSWRFEGGRFGPPTFREVRGTVSKVRGQECGRGGKAYSEDGRLQG